MDIIMYMGCSTTYIYMYMYMYNTMYVSVSVCICVVGILVCDQSDNEYHQLSYY